jgi:hypothetical protein
MGAYSHLWLTSTIRFSDPPKRRHGGPAVPCVPPTRTSAAGNAHGRLHRHTCSGRGCRRPQIPPSRPPRPLITVEGFAEVARHGLDLLLGPVDFRRTGGTSPDLGHELSRVLDQPILTRVSGRIVSTQAMAVVQYLALVRHVLGRAAY